MPSASCCSRVINTSLMSVSAVTLLPFESVTSSTIVSAPIGRSRANCSLMFSRMDSWVMSIPSNKIPISVFDFLFRVGNVFVMMSALVSTSNSCISSRKLSNEVASLAIRCTLLVMVSTPAALSKRKVCRCSIIMLNAC